MRAVFADGAALQRHARLRGGARARRGGDRRDPRGRGRRDRQRLRRRALRRRRRCATRRATPAISRFRWWPRSRARVARARCRRARLSCTGAPPARTRSTPALVLQLRDALALIDARPRPPRRALATQARAHRATPMLAGRTWLQQATAGDARTQARGLARRRRPRIARASRDAAAAHRGAAVRRRGRHARVARRARHRPSTTALAARPRTRRRRTSPWHTQRDRVGEVGDDARPASSATLGKLARDVALLAQTEVGEAFEPAAPGRGGSSTHAAQAQSGRRGDRARGRDARAGARGHDARRRRAGARARPRQLARRMGDAAGDRAARRRRARRDGGRRRRPRRRRGADARESRRVTQGQILAEAVQMALAPALGRDAAHALVADACRRATAQQASLARRARATTPQVARRPRRCRARAACSIPPHYLGATDTFIDRVLAPSPRREDR